MRTLLLTFLAGSIAFIVDLAIGAAAPHFTRAPQSFPPFTTLPILAGTFGGATCASIVYSIIKMNARNPDRVFFFVSLAVFALALGLPLRLSYARSPRFSGVTPSAQMVLVLMHAVVATVSFVTLTTSQTDS
jgi:hypothetical protein